MAKELLDSEHLKDSHIFLHPARYRIMELLLAKPMHVNGLSKALGEERRLVAYHLESLETHGFVTSKYEISEAPKSRGKALRMFTATDKVAAVKAALKRIL